MIESQADRQARVDICAREIMEYTGPDEAMRTAQNVLRSINFVVQDIFYVPYEDANGEWRLWTIKLPKDADGNIVWEQKMRGPKDGYQSKPITNRSVKTSNAEGWKHWEPKPTDGCTSSSNPAPSCS